MVFSMVEKINPELAQFGAEWAGFSADQCSFVAHTATPAQFPRAVCVFTI